jgi:hypothetical protein
MFGWSNRRLIARTAVAAAGIGLVSAGPAFGQQTPQQGQPGGAPPAGAQAPAAAGQPRAGFFPDTLIANDTTGFVSLFDGTLKNWDGDPAFWRAESNTIVGESSPTNVVKQNTFLIYRGDERLRDFELKLEIRMNSTNSGIQFRSRSIPGDHKWRLAGYQADFDFTNQYTGGFYDEQGRQFLALRGQFGRGDAGGKRRPVGKIGDDAMLKGIINIGGWNRLRIIARGNLITYMINDVVTSQFIDDDPENRDMEGLLGLQMHVGPPMKVEFRNLYLKKF